MTASEAPDTLPPWTAALGYGGLIPFLACAGVILAAPDLALRELAGRALIGYGAVILAFLGGVHWGLVLRTRNARSSRLLAIGVLPSLAGWATLFLQFDVAVAVQVAAFGGFWLYEHRVLGPMVVPPAYLGLRRWLTLVACVALGLALMASTLAPL